MRLLGEQPTILSYEVTLVLFLLKSTLIQLTSPPSGLTASLLYVLRNNAPPKDPKTCSLHHGFILLYALTLNTQLLTQQFSQQNELSLYFLKTFSSNMTISVASTTRPLHSTDIWSTELSDDVTV